MNSMTMIKPSDMATRLGGENDVPHTKGKIVSQQPHEKSAQ